MTYTGKLYGKVAGKYVALTIPDHLAINSTRYAIGRMTYTVQETVEWLMANWDNITPKAQGIIARDVAEAINEDTRDRIDRDLSGGQRVYLRLGQDMDRREWDKLAAFFSERGVRVEG